MQEPVLKKIARLKVLELKKSEEGPTVILFHGYGANCYDLAPLAQVIDAPTNTNWYFPDAPLEVPIGTGTMGKAWFPIDLEAFMMAQQTGIPRDLSNSRPEGLNPAHQLAHEFLEEIRVPPHQLILGGFSQGAMLATDLTFQQKQKNAGLVILSGTLLDSNNWEKWAAQKKGLPFFQSHGRSDFVLGFEQAKKLETLLKEKGLEGNLIEFSGGHEIPQNIILELGKFLRRVL